MGTIHQNSTCRSVAKKREEYHTINLMSHTQKNFLSLTLEIVVDALFAYNVFLQRCPDANQNVFISLINFK